MSVEDQLARAQQQLADCAVKINNQRAEIRRLEACREETGQAFQSLLTMYKELRRETDTDGDLVSHEQAVEAIRDRTQTISHLRSEMAEYDALFDLQHSRLAIADSLYVESHPRPEYPNGYRPDLAALVDWLLEFHAYVKDLSCDCHDDYGTPRKQPCDRCRLLGKKIVTYRTAVANRELCLRDR